MLADNRNDNVNSDYPLGIVTAASLFDGHDAAINIMRRLIQAKGVEVIHLGHNRSVNEVVRAAIQEDADAIALSSYQGGHLEYFRYVVDQLRELGASHIQVFGGGGGTITHEESKQLQDYGVARIYHPEDGMKMGLVQMIDDLISRCKVSAKEVDLSKYPERALALNLTAVEEQHFDSKQLQQLRQQWRANKKAQVIGLTGTGGAGKSSVTDEFLVRFLAQYPDKKIAVLAVDPTRRKTGGALLGDRIRINALRSKNTFMRSIATRRQHLATAEMLGDLIACLSASEYDLVLVETAGIGQSDSEIVDLVDFSIYVMTSEFGAPSQLEKIDMLDFADVVLLNKFDQPGSLDARRDIRKQWQRNHQDYETPVDGIPIFCTIASKFNDQGMNQAFTYIMDAAFNKQNQTSDNDKISPTLTTDLQQDSEQSEPQTEALIPENRSRYLSEIAEAGRNEHERIESQAKIAHQLQNYYDILAELDSDNLPQPLEVYSSKLIDSDELEISILRRKYNEILLKMDGEKISALQSWPERYRQVNDSQYSYKVRGKEITG